MLLKVLFFIATLLISTNTISFAQADYVGTFDPPNYIDPTGDAIQTFIPTLMLGIYIVGIIGLIVYVVFGALKWIDAGGDPKAIAAARAVITNAIIGFILLFLAFAISTVFDILNSGGVTPVAGTKPIYICGNASFRGPAQQGCTDPARCGLCAKPTYYISDVALTDITSSPDYGDPMSSPLRKGTVCQSMAECDAGCDANNAAGRYMYCLPPNAFR